MDDGSSLVAITEDNPPPVAWIPRTDAVTEDTFFQVFTFPIVTDAFGEAYEAIACSN